MHMLDDIIKMYQRLLVDLSHLAGVSLDIPAKIEAAWVLIEAPLLDKQILRYLEGECPFPDLPEWLRPLGERFILTDDPIILRYLRTALVFCYKAEIPPTDEQLKAAERQFEETDASIEHWNTAYRSGAYAHTLRTARRIVSSIIYRINWSEVSPCHGPGAVYPTSQPCDKTNFRTFYTTIREKYPYDQFFFGLPSFWEELLVRNDHMYSESNDIVAKLVAVPKDSRGPRLICVHPCESIWIQQGQRQLLERAIAKSPLTKGRINFTDQTVNGKLALTSSQSREFVTLDLKEASDRISCELVRDLFGDYAYSWISCSRANKVKLLNERVIELRKWAPMGNALCFPVQSLVFFALVVSGIRAFYGENCKSVWVFGDDIIYPAKYHEGVIRVLVASGLVPNTSKTFVKGFFRESCGVDAYKGIDVTPLRCKAGSISSLGDILSLTSLAKAMRLKGYECASASLYSMISKVVGYKLGANLPITNNPESQGICEYRDVGSLALRKLQKVRYNRALQKSQVRTILVSGREQSLRNGEWFHLQDALLALSRKRHVYQAPLDTRLAAHYLSDLRSGTSYPIPSRYRLKYGWTDIIQ